MLRRIVYWTGGHNESKRTIFFNTRSERLVFTGVVVEVVVMTSADRYDVSENKTDGVESGVPILVTMAPLRRIKRDLDCRSRETEAEE